MIFCTVFNARYLLQGLALYRSLERVMGEDFKLYVLCIDDFTYSVLAELELPSLHLVALGEIEDDQLRALREARTATDYCSACIAPLLLYVLGHCPADCVATYLDSHCFFFSNPKPVLDELNGKSILVHEYDFAPEYAHLMEGWGRFNVGLASFRNDSEGRQCLERWKEQCLDERAMERPPGKDVGQNCLDQWPSLFADLAISSNPGIGLAPWNVSKHKLRTNWRGVTFLDGRPLVLYHFRSLQLLRPRVGVTPIIMAQNYVISQHVAHLIYAPYAHAVYEEAREISSVDRKRLGHRLTRELPTVPDIYRGVANRQLLFTVGPFPLPLARNPRAIMALYGIDPHRDDNQERECTSP